MAASPDFVLNQGSSFGNDVTRHLISRDNRAQDRRVRIDVGRGIDAAASPARTDQGSPLIRPPSTAVNVPVW